MSGRGQVVDELLMHSSIPCWDGPANKNGLTRQTLEFAIHFALDWQQTIRRNGDFFSVS
jgi:hypothetical protein